MKCHIDSALIEMKCHSDAHIRWAVALGMCGCTEIAAIQTLIELMEDPDDDVRNWATFELGTQCDADSSEIREALQKRLEDSFSEARDEAVWGLAKRKDSLDLRLLLERLESEKVSWADEWAAEDVLDLIGSKRGSPREELRLGLRKLLKLD
jgi:HEAT repeat protein